MGQSELKINLEESFETLPRAPIIEAVIEIRARAEAAWEESNITEQLKSKLPDYPNAQSQTAFQQEVTFSTQGPLQAKHQDLGWKGARFQSGDGDQVVQFNRDGFIFSRLQPYEHWERFRDEALRLWEFHESVSRPAQIERLGLRFINRISLPVGDNRFEDYIQPHAQPPQNLDLPFHGFFHFDRFAVPGYPYDINIVRTIETPQDPRLQGIAIILDIDVYSDRRFELREELLLSRLAEMRWLKNKVFFGSVTQKALVNFR